MNLAERLPTVAEYDFIKLYMDELLECFETKTCDECFRQFEEDYDGAPVSDGDQGSAGGDKNSDDSMADDTPKESTKSDSSKGCSVLMI